MRRMYAAGECRRDTRNLGRPSLLLSLSLLSRYCCYSRRRRIVVRIILCYYSVAAVVWKIRNTDRPHRHGSLSGRGWGSATVVKANRGYTTLLRSTKKKKTKKKRLSKNRIYRNGYIIKIYICTFVRIKSFKSIYPQNVYGNLPKPTEVLRTE